MTRELYEGLETPTRVFMRDFISGVQRGQPRAIFLDSILLSDAFFPGGMMSHLHLKIRHTGNGRSTQLDYEFGYPVAIWACMRTAFNSVLLDPIHTFR